MAEPKTPLLRMLDLSRGDAAELRRIYNQVPEEDARLEEEELPPYRLGEPVTFVLLASATMAAIGVLGAFLMKRRSSEDVHYRLEVEYPDGTRATQLLQLSRRQSEAPDPEVVRLLATMTRFPEADVLAAVKNAQE